MNTGNQVAHLQNLENQSSEKQSRIKEIQETLKEDEAKLEELRSFIKENEAYLVSLWDTAKEDEDCIAFVAELTAIKKDYATFFGKYVARKEEYALLLEERVASGVDRIINQITQYTDTLDSFIFTTPSENDMVKKTENSLYLETLKLWPDYEEHIKDTLWKNYCEKKLLFVRHFPHHSDSPEYLKYKEKLDLFFVWNPSLAQELHEQDMQLSVKNFSELTHEEDIYSPIFSTGYPVEILLDSSWKKRNQQTALQLTKQFPNTSISSIKLTWISKWWSYTDELLHAIAEFSTVIYGDLNIKNWGSLFVVIANSSFAPIFALTKWKTELEIKKECAEFVKNGVACIDLNAKGKILGQNGLFFVTPKNYQACMRVFVESRLDYVDLQNLINFRLLNEDVEQLTEWLNVSEDIPDLQPALIFQLLRRGMAGYKSLWWFVLHHRLSDESLSFISQRKNDCLNNVAIRNVYRHFDKIDPVKLANLDFGIDLSKQIQVLHKISQITRNSLDPIIQRAHPLFLADMLDEIEVTKHSKCESETTTLREVLFKFYEKEINSENHYILTGGTWTGKSVLSAAIASILLLGEYLQTYKPVKLYEWRDLDAMSDQDMRQVIQQDVDEDAIIIIDWIDEVSYWRQKIILDSVLHIKNPVFLSAKSNLIDLDNQKYRWHELKFKSIDQYKFLLRRSEDFVDYSRKIREYNIASTALSLNENPLTMVLYFDLVSHKEGSDIFNSKSNYAIFSYLIRDIFNKHLSKKSNVPLSRMSSHLAQQRLDKYMNRLAEFAYKKLSSNATAWDLSSFEDLAELGYMHKTSGESFVFASDLIEHFFCANYFITRSANLEELLSIESILNTDNSNPGQHSPAFKLVLDYALGQYGPEKLYEKLIPNTSETVFNDELSTSFVRWINYFGMISWMKQMIKRDIELWFQSHIGIKQRWVQLNFFSQKIWNFSTENIALIEIKKLYWFWQQLIAGLNADVIADLIDLNELWLNSLTELSDLVHQVGFSVDALWNMITMLPPGDSDAFLVENLPQSYAAQTYFTNHSQILSDALYEKTATEVCGWKDNVADLLAQEIKSNYNLQRLSALWHALNGFDWWCNGWIERLNEVDLEIDTLRLNPHEVLLKELLLRSGWTLP